ncbi:MAG: FAD-binding oxidoreductase [Actinomycetes bacterium]
MPSIEPEAPGPTMALRRKLLNGWGGTSPSAGYVHRPTSAIDLRHALVDSTSRGSIARGLGRSYGDNAQNAGGRIIDTTGVSDFYLDEATGVVRASAGATLDAIMRELIPRGFFVPVTPGTRFVTVGGAVAADIHGKNHHRAGSFGDHVLAIELALVGGSLVEISPTEQSDLFWATLGGMGLTGLIVSVTFQCPRIETSQVMVDTDRAPNLDAVMELMETGDDNYDYSVAWIDLLARGAKLGRSILTRGRFAHRDEVPTRTDADARSFDPSVLVSAPRFIPSGLLNQWSIRAFNEVWFRKAPHLRRDELQSISTFFHPLDLVDHWNRIYGRRGFIQWQYAVPVGAEETVRRTVDALSTSGCTSFLAVLKRFGPSNAGPLSFPIPGWTLALDIPTGAPGLTDLLDRLDEQIVEAGGRIYLPKDSRLRPELVQAMYPRLDEWRAIRNRVDPDQQLQSDLSRRLNLI